jgi:hypothetical protein
MKKGAIDIRVLRELTTRIFSFIENDLKVETITLEHNLYWDIPAEALHELGSQPSQLDVGSLHDDIQFVLSAYRAPDQAVPLTLIHVAPLLKAISTILPSYKPPEKNTLS